MSDIAVAEGCDIEHVSEAQTKLTEALAVLGQWRSDSQLFISLSPPFSVTLEVDRTVMRDTLERSAMTEQEFRAASNEVGLILLNVLNRTEERYIQTRGAEEASDVSSLATHTTPSEREANVREVKARLYDDYLQGRYDLKKSSKAPSFKSVDWDVKVKHYDANFDEFRPFPYTTLRLSFQRDFEDSAFAILGGRTFDSVQVNFSKDELDYLIRVLSRARERLVSLEGEQE